MKELLEEIQLKQDESFFIGVFQDHIDQTYWHYHQEYELSFITEGSGKRIVGDSIEKFNPGDLILIGPRIPHAWFSEKKHRRQHSGRTLESVYLQFTEKILPDPLTSLPELARINRALQLSERGIRITGSTLNEVSGIMLQLPYLKGFRRLMHFYEIMHIIGSCDEHVSLASEGYIRNRLETTNSRVKRIHEFLIKNYQEDIDLKSVAEVAHMAPASVCRFFKQSTGKTIFGYLNKIKIDYSCQLLLHTDLNIEDISYNCGFNNLSHFNKQFRKFWGTSPSRFRKMRDLK